MSESQPSPDVLIARRMAAIDKLHGEHNVYEWNGRNGHVRLDLCVGCGYPWPCPTRRLLDTSTP